MNKIKKDTSFCTRCQEALKEVGESTTSFDKYSADIYRKFRNLMVHPKKVEMQSFDDLSFEVLLVGFESGWRAYEALYKGLDHPFDQDSWKIMCATYGVPHEIVKHP